ncbi:hypothetical protein ACOBQB_06625 [Streptomyces sp. G5(2025)]|uniref:hypothetical protein n=1 Tax=Streptomyces sp. G5(2025) TaxID=3406628 RepID=UPI003C17CC28
MACDRARLLEPKERRQLSRKARAVLDRYLAAPDGWPKRALPGHEGHGRGGAADVGDEGGAGGAHVLRGAGRPGRDRGRLLLVGRAARAPRGAAGARRSLRRHAASAELLDFLGEGPLKSGPGRTGLPEAHGDLRQVTCAVSRRTEHHAGRPTHDASVEVAVESAPERRGSGSAEERVAAAAGRYGALHPEVSSELPPAALGRGRQGLFTTGGGFMSSAAQESATTTVLLDCARDRGGPLVTVDVGEEDVTLDDPRRRTAYARIATATAAKASRSWGCDAPLGKPLRTVALPMNADEDVPLADASGSCRGVPGRGARVSRAWEGRPAGGPVEVCVVGGGPTGTPAGPPGGDARSYRLVAYYGPYAQAERLRQQERHGRYSEEPVPGEAPAGRLPGGGHWASAACHDGLGPALFTVRPSDATDAEADETDESDESDESDGLTVDAAPRSRPPPTWRTSAPR